MSSPLKDTARPRDTRRRIIEAAGEVFAARGFRRATVREICRRAGANLAGVNYHFRDKRGLYLAAISHWQRVAFERYPNEPGAGDGATPEDRLRAFVKTVLLRMLEEGGTSIFGRLMAREIVEPTDAIDYIVEEAVRPTFGILSSIVRDLLGPEASEQEVLLCSASIAGQCLYFFYARPVFSRLIRKETFSVEEIGEIAAHIASFSLGALRSLASEDGEGVT